MMTDLHHNSGDFSRLKSLLLREEQQVLAEIEHLVSKHEHRIGDDKALQHSVAEILANALREAEVKNHRELASAIAPVVVMSIKREIRNSSDEVVDAMYPIMGRLIRAYVSSAIRDFVEQTNRRLEGGLSARFLRLRIKSLFTRTPYRTLLIREGQELRATSIYLINRTSGTLIEAWNADLADVEIADDHLIGGMLTAINNFAAESFAEKESELRALDLGEARVFLRASAAHLIAIKTVGKGNRKIRRLIDRQLQIALEGITDRGCGDQRQSREAVSELADNVTALVAKHKRWPIFAIFLFTGLFIFAGMMAFKNYQEQAAIAKLSNDVHRVIASRSALQAFPLKVQVAKDRSAVTVEGLVPTVQERQKFIEAATARLRPVRLNANLTVVPPLDDYLELSGSVADLNKLISKMNDDVARRTSAEFAATRARIEEFGQQLKVTSTDLGERISELHRITQDPLLKLSQWVLTHAVFFAEETTFRDRDLAIKTLMQLTDLLALSDAKIRIIGYTDPTGTTEGNDALASLRAEQVARELAKLGVPRARMKVLGRPRGVLLSDDKGPYSSNRRVEFEIAYAGEPTRPRGEPLSAGGENP